MPQSRWCTIRSEAAVSWRRKPLYVLQLLPLQVLKLLPLQVLTLLPLQVLKLLLLPMMAQTPHFWS